MSGISSHERQPPGASAWRRGLLALFGLACIAGGPARAGGIPVNGLSLGAGSVRVPVESFQAMRFAQTIHQAYDFSCGSAALATLLTYSYHRKVTERQVFLSMIRHGNRQAIERYGFSLLDMKTYLARQGIPSGGFDAPLSRLAGLHVPAIVLINDHGYRHFVVLRSIVAGRVLLSDPAVGLRSESVARFRRQWSGVSFLVMSEAARAQRSFEDPRLWRGSPPAPTDIARYALGLARLQEVTIPIANRF
ncbi:MAG TPA: C39 family peptidase [Acidiphilium sp.]|uniref:C39 family peptidase n=1 Tax=unclassified Acidiphilium TaxID=2617493 RepID=UPI000BD6F9F7|nr:MULTISPECIES: C39 family peptidase [unclassified Acidiphilium]OYV56517.1 MAG: peptidase C39 [Acidiphilium sp. 20-67-58]HQT59792.1 C39 family peptidase [Acidiphilium sp.]HQU10850.1 C39 family peptidase [Acidiphilium sp.]